MKGVGMRIYRGVVASVAALVLMAPASAAADTTTQTLRVVGAGTAFVSPDVADLTVSVSRSGLSSRRALSAANRATGALVRVIRSLGIPASDIQTQDVNVSPLVKRVGSHKRRVWRASESLSVRVRHIRLVGVVVDRVTRTGASNVYGPTYSFSDPSVGKIQATRAAIADARRRADAAAATIGYKVTGVQSVQLDFENQGAAGGSGSSPTSSAGTPTAVHPGTQEVDVQVEIVYTIAPT
jgi:uncharacterized protein YggE